MRTWFWRDTARPAQFFGIDAFAVYPFLLFMLHMKWWTFILAIVAMIALAVLSRHGFTLPVFYRVVRSYLAGPARFAVPWSIWIRRRRR